VKQAEVRFYFDADILGLGKLISGLRPDCTFPGDPGAVIHKRQRRPCSVTSPATVDTDWISRVTAEGLLIVTRDAKIQRRVAEVQAVVEHGATMVALTSKDATTLWSQLEVFMTQWRNIEQLHGLPGPFIYRASRTALTKLDLKA
jgi:PIN like domain